MHETQPTEDDTHDPIPRNEGIKVAPMPAQDTNPSHHTRTVNAICADLARYAVRCLLLGEVHDRRDGLAKAEPQNVTLQALSNECAYRLLDVTALASAVTPVARLEPRVIADGGDGRSEE